MPDATLTPSQVKKAGQTIRRYLRNEPGVSAVDYIRALSIVQDYRALHQPALVKANNGLRSMVRSEGCQVEVSQRLKRLSTIVNKLQREPTLPLSSMQDIGGVRSVLASIDEIQRVQRRLEKRRPVLRISNYIDAPRISGYRGIHVVVLYADRPIEVQLRTRAMHEWAIAVERLSADVDENLKQDGEHAVQQWLALISEAMAVEELGEIVDPGLINQISKLRTLAAPYLSGGA